MPDRILSAGVVVVRRVDDGWRVLLLRVYNYWDCPKGVVEPGEDPLATARREVREETGIDATTGTLTDWGLENVYDIYPRYLHRYAPGVTRNREHVFGLCVPAGTPVALNPREHTAYQWLPWRKAADRCGSASNAEAILMLPEFTG